MTFSQYPQLKQEIVISVSTTNKPNKLLFDLKEHYKDKINSPRRNEQIQTIGQLLIVLEIRDILSESNIKPLKEIAQRVGNCEELLYKIEEFEKVHVPTENHNYYDADKATDKKYTKKYKQCNGLANKDPYTNISQKKKQIIHMTVVKQIGIYWRDLARNLKVTECVIDEIDKECEILHSKALRLMEIYEKEADPQKGIFVLCESLERARRKDLVKAIQEILIKD